MSCFKATHTATGTSLRLFQSPLRLLTRSWRQKVEAHRSDPNLLWQSIDQLLGRYRPSFCDDISVDQFSNFFTDKVERTRTAAVDVPPPDFSEKATDVHFDTFNAISVDDVITSICRLPNKTSAADPISTPVLKLVSDLLAPYITELFNRSMSSGQVPQCS
jgi:hypothetical protein